MATLQKAPQSVTPTQDEHILVVKRDKLFSKDAAWSGLKEVNFQDYLAIIKEHQKFLPRTAMEQDPTHKQIIPYMIFTHNDRYFLMQRKKSTTEQRLKSKYSFGIGGHIRQEDMETDALIDWAKREFDEEVSYNDAYSIDLLGILNDDSNTVGQVHVGFVMLVKGTSDAISVKSELQSGELLTLEECKAYFSSMETWSQIVFEYLAKNSG